MPRGGRRLGSGRKAKDPAVKSWLGEKASEPIAVPEWLAVVQLPPAPKTLDGLGRKVFRKTAKHLLTLGVLADVDVELISAYAHLVQRAAHAEEYLKEHGTTGLTGDGERKAHPEVQIAKDAWAAATRLAEKFGFSFKDRQLLKIPLSPPRPKLEPAEPTADGPERFFG